MSLLRTISTRAARSYPRTFAIAVSFSFCLHLMLSDL